MRRSTWTTLSLLTTVCVVAAAAVRGAGRPSKPGPELQRLAFYIGDWAYTEDYERSVLFPEGGHNTGSWTAQWGPRSLSVVHTFATNGTADPYSGMEIMVWDSAGRVYRDHAIWFDTAGQWEFTGRFEGEALVYHGAFLYQGKQVDFRSETRPRQGGGFTLDEYARVNGGPEQKILRGTAVPQ
jgi:hypothetical protein